MGCFADGEECRDAARVRRDSGAGLDRGVGLVRGEQSRSDGDGALSWCTYSKVGGTAQAQRIIRGWHCQHQTAVLKVKLFVPTLVSSSIARHEHLPFLVARARLK